MKTILKYTLLSFGLLLGGRTVHAQKAESNNMAAMTEMLSKMSPEQLQQLMSASLSQLDPYKRAQVEEVLDALKLTTPDVKSVQLKNKTVKFIPVAHVGQKEFYDNVGKTVQALKKEGYKVYYERIIKNEDPTLSDTANRKIRKMIGLEPTVKTYAMILKLMPNLVTQPDYKEWGVTDKDINADVYNVDLVKAYETKYGPITLNECDLNTPLGTELFPCDKLNNDIFPIILDFRNEHLVDVIKKSKDKKIVVIYGAKHIEPVMSML